MQLFVEGRDLDDVDLFTLSDPMCTLKTREANLPTAVWRLSGETEVIDNNLNPNWITHFTTKYIFNRDTDLHFQVYHYVKPGPNGKFLIGEVKISLSKIMMSPDKTIEAPLTNPKKPDKDKQRGILKIKGDQVKRTEDPVRFQIEANLSSKKLLCFGADVPYLLIERARNLDEENQIIKRKLEQSLRMELGENYIPPEAEER